MRTLCAICTRLSIFVPAPITVSSMLPRSIVVFAPISTSSSMMQRPTCGIFTCCAVALHVAEAVGPDARAGMNRHAIADRARRL